MLPSPPQDKADNQYLAHATLVLRSALFGALLLNEHLTQQGMAGAAVIFSALALVARKSSRGKRKDAGEDELAD